MTEDIAIVRRTVMAAYDAVLPAGCQRTIYLCDDGKDPKKRKFCDGLGPDVSQQSLHNAIAGACAQPDMCACTNLRTACTRLLMPQICCSACQQTDTAMLTDLQTAAPMSTGFLYSARPGLPVRA